MPYTYLIKSKSTGKFYYGLRYAKNCTPDDLWKTYFTSSKVVQELIEQYGKTDFEFEIRKVFDTPKAAIEWEHKVIKRMKLHSNDNFLNRGCWPSIGLYHRTDDHIKKLKDLAKAPGGFAERGDATRFQKGQVVHSWTTESRQKASLTRKKFLKENPPVGSKNSFYGKSHSEEFKVRQRKLLGKKVCCNDIIYDSIKYASEQLGISRYWLKQRLNSEKFKDYYYV